MMATTFWSVDGRPMSAAEFITRLFGDLPELFKDEDELRALWGEPNTCPPAGTSHRCVWTIEALDKSGKNVARAAAEGRFPER